MADQLQVVFSAEISGLVKATKDAQAAVGSFSDSVKSQSATVNTSITRALEPFAQFRPNVSAFRAASTSLGEIEVAAEHAGHGTAGFYRELIVLAHELSQGNYSRFGGSLMVLAERSGKLTEAFGLIRAAANPVTLALAAAAATIGVLTIRAQEAANSVAKIREAMASTGNGYLFDPKKIEEMTAALERSGVKAKDAASMLTELGRAANLTGDDLKNIQEALPDLVAKFGTAEAAGKALKQGIDDPAAAIRELHDEMARNNPDLLNAAQNFVQMGDKASATRVLLDYLTESAKGLHDKGIAPLSPAWRLLKFDMDAFLLVVSPVVIGLKAIGNAAIGTLSYVQNLGEAFSKMSAGSVGLKQALRSQSLQMTGQTYNVDQSPFGQKAIENIKNANGQLAEADDLVRKLNNEKTDKLQAQIAQLKNGLAAAEGMGKTDRVSSFNAAIAQTEKKIADERTRVEKEAASKQLQAWEMGLQGQLQQQKVFGDKAKSIELSYWQQRLSSVKQGTAEYATIAQKIYQLQSQNYAQDVQRAKEAERAKVEAAKKAAADRLRGNAEEQQEKVRLAQEDYSIDAERIQLKAQLGQISSAQELQQLQLLKKQEYEIERKALQDEEALWAKGSADQIKIHNQLLTLDKKYHLDSEKLTAQSITQQQQKWLGFAGSIKSSFNSAITGMIQGTQTFGQAVGSIFMSMGEAVFGVLEDIAAKWVVTQIVGDTASATGARAQIGADAATAGAAAFASTAAIPVVGPGLAPAAGAAAYAQTMAYQAAVPGFAVGAWEIPGDMMANIHKGEMILPKPFADSVRENGGFAPGGGGGDTHIHINAVDAQSVHKLFQQHGASIVASIHQQHRNGNPKTRGLGA
jgi:hypothetical protein